MCSDEMNGDGRRVCETTTRGDRAVSAPPPQSRAEVAADEATIFVVDDDVSFREALARLFRSVGLRAEMFGSTAELLESKLPDVAGCLVLDIRLPGLSGLDFQAELARQNIHVPIIFITGHGDIPMSVRAMKAGAIEFLTKPVREQDLLDAVQAGLNRDRTRRESDKTVSGLQQRYDSLTPREKEIIGYVASGLMNKQIAAEVGISEITVKVHRGNLMRKMGARSLADLVRMVDQMGLSRPRKGTI